MNTQEARHTFSKSHTELIRKHARESEQNGKLHPEIVRLIQREGWFKMYVPVEFGGVELSFPEILSVLENLAKADGSTGWTITLCSGASWFAGFMNEALVHEIFQAEDTCVTGSGAKTGTAVKTTNGYRILGNWKHASGALHATHFTTNCVVLDEDETPVLENGEPKILSFIFTKNEVEVIPNWGLIGMVATGSHGFTITDLEVSADRSFTINGEETIFTNLPNGIQAAKNYPFLQLAETTLAVNFSGMTLQFFELLETHFYEENGILRFSDENRVVVENAIKTAKRKFHESRNAFYSTFNDSWEELNSTDKINPEQLKRVSLYSRALVKTSKQVFTDLFPYCGFEILRTDSDLNRVWRDIHTAGQHALFTF